MAKKSKKEQMRESRARRIEKILQRFSMSAEEIGFEDLPCSAMTRITPYLARQFEENQRLYAKYSHIRYVG